MRDCKNQTQRDERRGGPQVSVSGWTTFLLAIVQGISQHTLTEHCPEEQREEASCVAGGLMRVLLSAPS